MKSIRHHLRLFRYCWLLCVRRNGPVRGTLMHLREWFKPLPF